MLSCCTNVAMKCGERLRLWSLTSNQVSCKSNNHIFRTPPSCKSHCFPVPPSPKTQHSKCQFQFMSRHNSLTKCPTSQASISIQDWAQFSKLMSVFSTLTSKKLFIYTLIYNSFLRFIFIYCTHVCLCLYMSYVRVCTLKGQTRASDSLKLNLWVIVNHPSWMLGTRLVSSGRTTRELSG